MYGGPLAMGSGPLAMGSGLLPTCTVLGVLGYYIPFVHDWKEKFPCLGLDIWISYSQAFFYFRGAGLGDAPRDYRKDGGGLILLKKRSDSWYSEESFDKNVEAPSGSLETGYLAKAKGLLMPYLTDECLTQMAKRMGTLLNANKVRKNGVIANDFLHFQVRLNLNLPLLVGVSLLNPSNKKIWSHFKYERLPTFCYKCGIIKNIKEDYSALKRMVSVHDGRSVPLFGPWLKDGSRLDNGFTLLEFEDLQDIKRMDKEDKTTERNQVGHGGPSSCEVAASPAGQTRAEHVRMEGVVSQQGDNAYVVSYKDYVDTKSTTGGPKSGAKRKNIFGNSNKHNSFVAESDGLSCLVGVDKTKIKDVFVDESGVNILETSKSDDELLDPSKKYRLLINSLRSVESSFGSRNEEVNVNGGGDWGYCY
ncbi:hypothetical protein F8388_024718 [Cannabis sativa]|uniref:Zinc knuckle CX2CX4HX4C domain-containing protein n=1 Tax=Cannabis sativa TaxID=3483 RepID=A0A7J6GBT2_CANSA|nr:hypothetical protein F8388_024718 [Cannabis sativa]